MKYFSSVFFWRLEMVLKWFAFGNHLDRAMWNWLLWQRIVAAIAGYRGDYLDPITRSYTAGVLWDHIGAFPNPEIKALSLTHTANQLLISLVFIFCDTYRFHTQLNAPLFVLKEQVFLNIWCNTFLINNTPLPTTDLWNKLSLLPFLWFRSRYTQKCPWGDARLVACRGYQEIGPEVT